MSVCFTDASLCVFKINDYKQKQYLSPVMHMAQTEHCRA